jgi:hypothetical protein
MLFGTVGHANLLWPFANVTLHIAMAIDLFNSLLETTQNCEGKCVYFYTSQ